MSTYSQQHSNSRRLPANTITAPHHRSRSPSSLNPVAGLPAVLSSPVSLSLVALTLCALASWIIAYQLWLTHAQFLEIQRLRQSVLLLQTQTTGSSAESFGQHDAVLSQLLTPAEGQVQPSMMHALSRSSSRLEQSLVESAKDQLSLISANQLQHALVPASLEGHYDRFKQAPSFQQQTGVHSSQLQSSTVPVLPHFQHAYMQQEATKHHQQQLQVSEQGAAEQLAAGRHSHDMQSSGETANKALEQRANVWSRMSMLQQQQQQQQQQSPQAPQQDHRQQQVQAPMLPAAKVNGTMGSRKKIRAFIGVFVSTMDTCGHERHQYRVWSVTV